MDALKKERTVVRRLFTKYANELEAILGSTPRDDENLWVIYKKLQESEDRLNRLNEKIKEGIVSTEFEEATLEKELNENDSYHKRWLLLELKLSKPKNKNIQNVQSKTVSNTGSNNLRYPKLELIPFNGDIKKWITFWGQFSKIDNDSTLEDTDKYLYLLQSTKEGSEVRSLVESFPASAYKECLQQLKDQYGKEELLIRVYVSEIPAIVINKSTYEKLSSLYVTLNSQLRSLETLGVTRDKYAAFLLPMVESTLPQELLKIWERDRRHNSDSASELAHILNFMKREVDSEQRMMLAKNTFCINNNEEPENNTPPKKTAECLVSTSHMKTKNVCIWCEKDSRSSLECYKIYKMNLEQRKKHLTDRKACLICLKVGHHAKTCKTFVKCLICKRRHSTVLCNEQKEDEKRYSKPEPATSLTATFKKEEILLQTVIVEVEHKNKKLPVRALFDTGSQRTYIKKDIVEKLGIPPCKKEVLSHNLFGGIETATAQHDVCKVTINSTDVTQKIFKLEIMAICQNNICGYLPKTNVLDRELNTLLNRHNIKLTDTDKTNITEIGLLIGADCLGFLFTGGQNIIQLKDGLVAIQSSLGWTLQGKVSVNVNNNITSTLHCTCDSVLNEYWSLETLGIRDPVEVKTKAETTADTLTTFRETIQVTSDNRYEVELPFKTNYEDLLPNYNTAKQRLESMVRKLKSSGNFEIYDQVFKKWSDLGIIERVNANPGAGHYLPHRPVIKESSLTSKVRPVFDASTKDKKGLSLNACLEKGNNLIDLIPNLIYSFRTGSIGITADIEKAFLQISLVPSNRDYLKFLWIEDENIVTYRHCRVVFGLTSSPFLLSATLQYHINKMKTESVGKSAEILGKSFYVDNCITSLDTVEEVQTFIREAKHIMKTAKFNLRMWVTSSGLNETGERTLPLLGINWDTVTDELYCNMKNLPGNVHNITKRELLSLIQRIFDPIGYTAPVMLPPKLILQETWRRKLAWDKEIPPDLLSKFHNWYKHISYLDKCRVPRRLAANVLKRCEVSLHLFCDASKDGVAACILVRAEKENNVTVQLIAAKSRVTPPQTLTIPRLELTAALIGSRLLTQVRENKLLHDCPQYCWTDSGVSLCWIKRDLHLNTYVGNRVKEIRQHTNANNWYHIPGEKNWADLASRGCNAKALYDCRWWEGPEWLRLPTGEWPRSELLVDEREVYLETKKSVCNTNIVNEDNLLYRMQGYFSKYTKIVRMVAWMLRFIYNTSHKKAKKKGEITYKEFENAEKIIVKLIQTNNVEFIQKRSGNLTQFRDKEGIIRIKSKLLLTEYPEGVKTPYLIVGKDPVVKSMVKQRHVHLQHAGTNLMISDIRNKFWIIGIRKLVKTIISECVICTRHRAKPVQAPAAPLPVERTMCEAAFQTTGVDLAGPLYLRNGEKVWIVLYTCAVYRAVHLELTRSLSSEAFMMTLRRFIARRGRMTMMMSDQGTNFCGTKNLLSSLDWEEIERESTIRRITWKMNAPSAAWWGGYWERLIRIMKDLLRRIIGNAALSYDELETLICECEAIMNSRPLTYVGDDKAECLEPLTPAYFIQPTPNSDMTDLDKIDAKSMNSRLQYLQKLREQFHQRFKSDYLIFLVQKGREKEDNISVGDVVLVESEEKRLKWPLGIVQDLISGRDGVQRTARIKTATGVKVRPVQRLYKLEISGNNISFDLKPNSHNNQSVEDPPGTPQEAKTPEEMPALHDKLPQSTRCGRKVILLIYEYAIAVEWSIVQRRIGVNGTNDTNITKDNPHADKLDRSFFGFDQDYYERMPLLVNALQESNYIDPVIEMSRPISKNTNERYTSTPRPTYATEVYKQSTVRRTSPRPFYFEYRSATPLPFSKTYGSRSWIDGYRNEQRLQNIRQVIKYLEKTINAKAADMHMKASGETSIAFSGVYVEPKVEKTEFKDQDQEPSASSTKTVETDWNHQSDPLFKFKPDTPGDVNLLADSSLRFLPIPSLIDDDIPKRVPMFKRVPNRKLCTGHKCNDNIETNILNLLQTSTEITTENPGTTKSFSVMLNLYPLNTKPTPATEKKRFDLRTRPPISKIYLTTSRPSIQFRKKTTPPVRRHQYRYKKPRYLIRKKEESRKPKIEESATTQYPHTESPKATTMVVHVNVYSVENKTEAMKKNGDLETTTSSSIKQSTYTPITNVPELYAGQVEDHHDGSSGVIHVPIHTHTAEPPILPPITTTHPYYETETANSDVNNWFTEPPNVLKFSPEDAKIPEHYINTETTQSIPTSTNRRAMDTDYEEEETLIIKLKNHAVSSNKEFSNTYNNEFSNNYNSYFANSNETYSTEDTKTEEKVAEVENKNFSNEERQVTEFQTENSSEASEETWTEESHTEQQIEETTTIQTYVPLINGHYRSISRSSPEIQTTRSRFLNRKRKLVTKMSGFKTYVPMYVEIKRNRTRVANNTDDENNEDE